MATIADWTDREPFQKICQLAVDLEDQQHDRQEITDSLLGIALHLENGFHGPREVARRLYMLALKFAGEAEGIDKIFQTGANRLVN